MLLCKFCIKECKNNISLSAHERSCPSNINRIYKNGMLGKKGGNQYTKAVETGIPYVLSQETRDKKSLSSTGKIWSTEAKNKHSDIMRNVVLENPDSYSNSNVCGRVKIKEYNGQKFHGNWEVIVAKWLDANNIKWERDLIKPFNYYWNNGWHLYFPDFYLVDLDKYIEVKGYETDRDKCKWSVVNNLIIIKSKEIKLIEEDKFGPIA